MAVPLKFYSSQKYPGRGKSIFSGGKSDCFDALDEVISQWWDALRMGRVKQYIPESMIPKNPNNGFRRHVNGFFVSSCTCISINLSIENNLAVFIVTHSQNRCFSTFHIVGSSFNKGIELTVVCFEKFACNAC